eukprot:Skav209165  [mRNA]  locus=scaffold1137:331213:374682:- [translate_table: standard]
MVVLGGSEDEVLDKYKMVFDQGLDRVKFPSDITQEGVEVLRDSMLDMWEAELGADFTPKARIGWFSLLNYWGGAFVYFQREYASRIKIIHRSWREANKSVALPEEEEVWRVLDPRCQQLPQEMLRLVVPGWVRPVEMVGKHATKYKLYGVTGEPCLFKQFGSHDAVEMHGQRVCDCWLVSSFAALAEYPDRVRSLFKQHELTEERSGYDIRLYCPHAEEWKVVTIDDRIPYWQRPNAYGTPCFAKPTKEMLGRGLPLSEDASALCDNLTSLTDTQLWSKLKGHAYTILRLLDVEIVRNGKSQTLQLMHVRNPHMTNAAWTTDDSTQAAFRFSLSLIAKILVRAVSEGSTLVMRAINTNQENAMKKAIAIAPRGKRAMELLNISVGTQSISPLFWSIESGSLNSARAMIVDLLTIRADRDVYYYGCEARLSHVGFSLGRHCHADLLGFAHGLHPAEYEDFSLRAGAILGPGAVLVGVAGGMQVLEPANANMVTEESCGTVP